MHLHNQGLLAVCNCIKGLHVHCCHQHAHPSVLALTCSMQLPPCLQGPPSLDAAASHVEGATVTLEDAINSFLMAERLRLRRETAQEQRQQQQAMDQAAGVVDASGA